MQKAPERLLRGTAAEGQDRKRAAAVSTARNATFHSVKTQKKVPFRPGYSPAKNLKEIRLARDAISVPRPPRFTPVRRGAKSAVNPASRMAAGTLLMIWLAAMPASSSWPRTR